MTIELRPRVHTPFAAALAAALVALGALTAVGMSPAGAAGSNKLTVKAGEYTYEFSGKPKAGLTEIVFDNQGIEDHMMGLVQLKKGVTRDGDALLQLDEPHHVVLDALVVEHDLGQAGPRLAR